MSISRASVAFTGIALVFCLLGPMCAKTSEAAFDDDLRKVRDLRRQNRLVSLCEWLDEVHVPDQTFVAPDGELVAQEAFLFEAGDAYYVEANRLTSAEAINNYAEKAFNIWRAYVGWYEKLGTEQANTYERRVFAATTHMGESLLMMQRCEQAIEEYEAADVSCIGSEALAVWKKALLVASAPKDNDAKATISKRIICQPEWKWHWQKYSEAAKSVASRLKQSKARSPERDADRIETFLSECDKTPNG